MTEETASPTQARALIAVLQLGPKAYPQEARRWLAMQGYTMGIGQVCNLYIRLESKGLLTSHEASIKGNLGRRVYALTQEGSDALAQAAVDAARHVGFLDKFAKLAPTKKVA
jgi:DNA-binding PadR family transcriptional regulator